MLHVRGRTDLENRFDPATSTPIIPIPTYSNATPTVPGSVGSLSLGSGFAVYIEYTDSTFSTSAANSPILLCISQGTSTTNRLYIRKANTGQRMQTVIQNMTEIWQGFLSSFANGTHKLLITGDSTGCWFYIDGHLLSWIDTSYTQPTGLDSVYVGRLNSGTSNNYAPTSSANLQIWQRRLTDAQCRMLTGNVQIVSGITNTNKDIIAFLGQSNSSGLASGTGDYVNTTKMFLLSNALTSVAAYSDPFDVQTSARVSALSDSTAALSWAGYVIDAMSQQTGRDTVALPVNKASTCFLGTVSGGSVPTWDNNSSYNRTSGSYIVGANATITAAVQQMQIAKQFGNIRGVIWQGNEGDVLSTVAVNQAAFEAKYPQIVQELRQSLQLSLPWVDAGFPADNTWPPSTTVYNNIKNGKTNAIAVIPTSTIVPEIFNINGAAGDRIHFDKTGIVAGYQYVADAAVELFY